MAAQPFGFRERHAEFAHDVVGHRDVDAAEGRVRRVVQRVVEVEQPDAVERGRCLLFVQARSSR